MPSRSVDNQTDLDLDLPTANVCRRGPCGSFRDFLSLSLRFFHMSGLPCEKLQGGVDREREKIELTKCDWTGSGTCPKSWMDFRSRATTGGFKGLISM
jgi:hypothetical protein